MRQQSSRARLTLALCGAAALAGCSTVSSLFSSSDAKGPPAASCPTASILRPLAQTAQFAPGAAHRPTGVAFYGVLSDVSVKCDRSGGALRAALDIVIIGERGPAGGGGTGVDLQYFVAVTGPDQVILSKRSYAVRIELAANTRRAGVTDRIEEIVPTSGRNIGDLNIVLGFQQSPDVVEFYRHFRGR